MADMKADDRKLVTKSSLSFLNFVKRSYKDRPKIKPETFFAQPMAFGNIGGDMFKGTMFEPSKDLFKRKK